MMSNVPVSLDDIHQIIGCSIWLSYGNIDIVNSILAENCLDLIVVDVRKRNCVCDRDPSLFLFANCNIRRFFVETNTESF